MHAVYVLSERYKAKTTAGGLLAPIRSIQRHRFNVFFPRFHVSLLQLNVVDCGILWKFPKSNVEKRMWAIILTAFSSLLCLLTVPKTWLDFGLHQGCCFFCFLLPFVCSLTCLLLLFYSKEKSYLSYFFISYQTLFGLAHQNGIPDSETSKPGDSRCYEAALGFPH